MHAENNLMDHLVQPLRVSDQEAENKREWNICLKSGSSMVSGLGSGYFPSHWADLTTVTETFQDKCPHAHMLTYKCTYAYIDTSTQSYVQP